jgi:hypothetical protein
VLVDPAIRKWAHNAPHDRHALNNEGVDIQGLEDSLQYLRVLVPGMRDYGLKGAEQWALGYGPRPSFTDMVSYQVEVQRARRKVHKGCICGRTPCHAKGTSEWLADDGVWRPHLRVTWKVFTPIPHIEDRELAVTDFVPDAVLPPLVWNGQALDRLDAWWGYSLADAVRGIELVDWMRHQRERVREYPWRQRLYPSP